MSRDPLGQAAGVNEYAYTGGNPTNLTDPTGHLPVWLLPAAVGGLSGAGFDLAIQLVANDGDWSCVSWSRVGAAGLAGAAFSGGAAYGFEAFNAWRAARAAKNLSLVNLANAQRTKHILFGDATGGGHKFGFSRILNGKTKFPVAWSKEKIMNVISDIATNPKFRWIQQTGKPGSLFTKSGKAARFYVDGEVEGETIRVILEPAGEGIITAFKLF